MCNLLMSLLWDTFSLLITTTFLVHVGKFSSTVLMAICSESLERQQDQLFM